MKLFTSLCAKKSIVSSFFLIVVLPLISCADFFQGKIDMDSSSSSGTLSSLVTSEEEITQLPAPTTISVSQGLYAGKIVISWHAVTGATSYRVERAIVTQANVDGTFTAPLDDAYDIFAESSTEGTNFGGNSSTVYDNSFTDIVLDTGTATSSAKEYGYGYFYRVSAENANEGYDSSKYITSPASYLLAPPTSVSADKGKSTDYITVSWKQVNGCTRYDISRALHGDAIYTTIASVVPRSNSTNSNYYADTVDSGSEYDYKITGYRNGNYSLASSCAYGYTLMAGAPSMPTDVVIVEDKGRGDTVDSISISWTASTAESAPNYYIYRSSSVDSSLILLNAASPVTETSYTDKSSLKTGVYYYYQICSWILDDDGVTKLKSAMSNSDSSSASPAEGFLLSPPSTVSSSKDSNNIHTVSWTPAIGSTSEQSEYSYVLYGSSTNTFTESSTILASIATPELSSDGMYHYTPSQTASYYALRTIRTVAGNTITSSFSAATQPAPFAAVSVSATDHAWIDGITNDSANANSKNVYPVKITWSAPQDSSVAGYYVYRSSSPTSGYKKLNAAALSVDTLSYIDSNSSAKVRTLYYYKVLTINANGEGSNYSDYDTGYGAITYDQYMIEYNKTVKNSQSKLTLMHKSGNTDKLGTETINGTLSGTLYYNATIAGLGGRVIMLYTNYADYYIVDGNASSGVYFCINGNTNTSASMDTNGTMDGTVTCTGMYPGTVGYDSIKIVSGAAGGGTYKITPEGFPSGDVSYTIGNQ
jgi:hypothetical protein